MRTCGYARALPTASSAPTSPKSWRPATSTRVVITGAATDYCIDATARSALSLGFNVVLVEDAHAPVIDSDTPLTAEQIVAHHNEILSQAIHPGGTLRVVAAADVFAGS